MRLRLTFAKTAAMKFTGHLDLHRTWERTIRRARLPLAYSEGFNPHPKINLGAALPLGFTSDCEMIDIWLAEPMAPGDVLDRLRRAAPPGIDVKGIDAVDDRAPSMQTQIVSSDYRVVVDTEVSVEALDDRIAAVLSSSQVLRERRGKPYDLRPLIESLERDPGNAPGHTLLMRLSAREGATGRPEEVLGALGIGDARARVHRVRLNVSVDNPA